MPTTATEWLNDHPDDANELALLLAETGTDIELLTELPFAVQKEIAAQLTASFQQPYWLDIQNTTQLDAERALQKGLSEGWSIRKIAKEMCDPTYTSKYAKRRSLNIARTEAGNALNGARKSSMNALQEELGGQVPMAQMWLSVLGETTRDTHAALDGVPADENGLWNLAGHMVSWPGHTSLPAELRCNCFPEGTLVSGDFVGATRCWYEGVFTEIVLGSGGRLTVTPQHPIVTDKGLIPAGKIKPGQKVLSHNLQVETTLGGAFCSNEIKDKPVPIEQVFEAFFAVGAVEPGFVEVRSRNVNDFYGDGKSIQGNIEIVRTNRKLLKDWVAGEFDKCGNPIFLGLPPNLSHEFGFGSSSFAFDGIMGTATGCPCLSKGLLDILGRFEVMPAGSLAVGIAANFDSRLDKSASEDGPGIASFLRDALERHSGLVVFDDVIQVRNYYSARHVYDLQSRYGVIVATDSLYTNNSGIATANCQCTITMELGMDAVEAQHLRSEYSAFQDEFGLPKEYELDKVK